MITKGPHKPCSNNRILWKCNKPTGYLSRQFAATRITAVAEGAPQRVTDPTGHRTPCGVETLDAARVVATLSWLEAEQLNGCGVGPRQTATGSHVQHLAGRQTLLSWPAGHNVQNVGLLVDNINLAIVAASPSCPLYREPVLDHTCHFSQTIHEFYRFVLFCRLKDIVVFLTELLKLI